MMTQLRIMTIITILASSAWFTSITTYSSETNNTINFPTQPCFIYDSRQSYINPFEMTSFSIGNPHIRYHRDISTVILDTQWFNNRWSKNIELKIELPFYQPDNSIGIDCTIFSDGIFTPHISSQNSPFTAIFGGELLSTYKLKWPIYTPVGNLAGTITSKGGLIQLMHATSNTTQHHQQLGFVLGGAIGVDYYINQWIGCFFEYSVKWHRMQFISQLEGLTPGPGMQQDPYHFFTSTFSIGFKTTF